ncbi:MAG: IclR family transcriptional regulator [Desulfobacteraceae bacterium]|nr:IclR family transcriptional regulator [Desulfobacteraceae bacterium]
MSVQSIDRAFDILELLSVEPRGMTMTDIGLKLDLHKSTVHRLLSSMRERGYIEKSAETGNYRLGLGFVELASLYLNSLELKTEAQPFLHRLTQKTGQTSFLAIRDGREVVYIDKVETYDSLRRYKIIGRRRPLHATSLGKALLSGLNDEEIDQLYADRTFEQLTPKTILSFNDLMKQIKEIRQQGWSIDDEENEMGTKCVGAPIFDYRDRVIASLSLAWDMAASPKLTWTDNSDYVYQCARDISIKMGYMPNRNRH